MNLALTHEAKKQFDHLPKVEQRKIKKKLDFLSVHAYAGKKLGGELNTLRSLRAWPYRILYYTKSEDIIITAILHRQSVYK